MDAWQWDGLFLFALSGFMAMVTTAVLVGRGRRRAAAGAITLACVAFLVFAVLNAPLTSDY